MSLRNGLARAAPRKSMQTAAQTLTLRSTDGWLTGDTDVGMSRDRAMKISTVNRCVEVLSNSMAVLPVYVMNEYTKERVPDHYLSPILWGRANEAMTSFDCEKLTLCNEVLRGNGYTWLHRSNSTGRVLEEIPLPPDYVTPWFDPDGKLWYLFSHPETGEMTRLRPDNVLHYKAYSEDGIEGISVLRRASMTLDTARAAQQYENSTWKSGGQPSGILTTESDLTSSGPVKILQPDGNTRLIDPKDAIRNSWEAIHRGPQNAFRVAVLDLGLKYQPISMTNSDAQFVESNEVRVADVCRFFGGPLHLVFAGKQSYASNEQNGIEYVNYTLLGYETQWGQEDSYKLLLPSDRAKGLRIKRQLKVFLRGDTTAQAAWYRTMREVGAYNVDEIRALEDMGKVPGGQHRYASWNYGPLETWDELSVIRALGKNTGSGGQGEGGNNQ